MKTPSPPRLFASASTDRKPLPSPAQRSSANIVKTERRIKPLTTKQSLQDIPSDVRSSLHPVVEDYPPGMVSQILLFAIAKKKKKSLFIISHSQAGDGEGGGGGFHCPAHHTRKADKQINLCVRESKDKKNSRVRPASERKSVKPIAAFL